MSDKCPNCKNYCPVTILSEYYNNIDNIQHLHLECDICKRQFNKWKCDKETIKNIYGKNFELYL